jgi:hypothetical protein
MATVTGQQHTEGPWTTEMGLGAGEEIAVVESNTFDAIEIYAETSANTAEEQAANARLIAAAPDLLAALRDAESKLTAASALLSACGELIVGQALRSGRGHMPTIHYDGSGETDAIELSTDCANAADRAAVAIAKAEGR